MGNLFSERWINPHWAPAWALGDFMDFSPFEIVMLEWGEPASSCMLGCCQFREARSWWGTKLSPYPVGQCDLFPTDPAIPSVSIWPLQSFAPSHLCRPLQAHSYAPTHPCSSSRSNSSMHTQCTHPSMPIWPL